MLKILLLVGLCFVVASAKELPSKDDAFFKFSFGFSYARNVPSRKELLKLNFYGFKEKDAENKVVSFKRYEGKCMFVGFYGPDPQIEGKLPLK